ncbi:MAG: hypothetical protein HC851_09500 [Acaryochloris sp. RU_4_1]|nr:hypothetical protein [Acaryochloris sp. RU_4_1]NJN37729.1 hypothetical protein [Acaryochloridaceae cyanobacterium CSU_3_4]NJR55208.1 hypothetical protein [Acaryochloris sp. CRU_2_0]
MGIGRAQQVIRAIEQEILSWYDSQSNVYPAPDTIVQQMQQQLKVEQQRAERLADRLRELGEDPDRL